MTDFTALLSANDDDGARVLALHHLKRLSRALARVQAHPERERPLHRARVELTRLRAAIATYDKPLRVALRKRDRRTLRTLHRKLGRVRDVDARIVALTSVVAALPPLAARDAQWLLETLHRERLQLSDTLPRAIAKHFRPYIAGWRKQLRYYTPKRVAGQPEITRPLSEHVATQLRACTIEVTHGLEEATRLATRDSQHRVRRHIKRLRALLWPWRHSVNEVPPVYEALTEAQALLGTMRDAELLAELARATTRRRRGSLQPLTALAEAFDQIAAESEAEFTCRWLGGSGARLGADVAALETALANWPNGHRAALADDGTPVGTPKATEREEDEARADAPDSALPMEIERKYLLRAVPPRALEAPRVRIAQGWLPGSVLRERLRRTVHPDGKVEWTRTVKAGTGIARVELEEAASAMLFESLWPFTGAARVEKVRHTVTEESFNWEIDAFLDRELVLAEVELPSVDTPVAIPEWLAPYVVREVTGDAAYVNANLARDSRRLPTAE